MTDNKHMILTFRILKSKDGHKLNKRKGRAHNLALKQVRQQEEKKRNKLKTDKTYNPKDKDIFNNNIDLWRIRCYNVIGIY